MARVQEATSARDAPGIDSERSLRRTNSQGTPPCQFLSSHSAAQRNRAAGEEPPEKARPELDRVVAEYLWIVGGRPYYNVHPQMVDQLCRCTLDSNMSLDELFESNDAGRGINRRCNEVLKNCLRIVATVGFLANCPDDNLLQYDVLSKHRAEFATADPTRRKQLIDKARRRGKHGWNIGTNEMVLGTLPKWSTNGSTGTNGEQTHAHIRSGHLHAVRYGKWRRHVKIKWFRPTVVRPDLPFVTPSDSVPFSKAKSAADVTWERSETDAVRRYNTTSEDSAFNGPSIMPRKRRRPSDYVTCKHCHRDFRAITVRHLRNIHGYDGDHPILEYKRRFRLATATCGEVRKRISETKEDFWARRGKHWTRQKLIAEIRKRHRAGKSLRGKKVPVRLYEAGRRIYGTWRTAVEKAGINYEKATGIHRWNPAKVVEAIQKLANKGVPLSASYVKEHHPTLFNAAVKQFPRSWAKALRAAGFNPDEHRQPRGRWTEQKAEDWVRRRLAEQQSLLARDAPRDLRDFVRNRGKGWIAFVESFGIPYPGVKKRRDWTKAKVLKEIRAWKRKGHRMNYRAVKQSYQALLQQAKKFFGSWDRARSAAGV